MPYPGISAEYEPYVLKGYQYGTLVLHTDQRYLGRAYWWLSRKGTMQRFSNLWAGELVELQLVLQRYELALEQLWSPHHMNYAWLGNFFHKHEGHGHMHIIPRYHEPREFVGVQFVDENWGLNYTPYKGFPLPDEKLFLICDALRDTLQSK